MDRVPNTASKGETTQYSETKQHSQNHDKKSKIANKYNVDKVGATANSAAKSGITKVNTGR